MVKIRLRRTGAKKQPSYRVVVTDSRSPRDGRFIEIIGHYNPRTDPVTINVEEDRVLHWLNEGAQPTDTVRNLLKNLGTLERFARLRAGTDLEELVAEAKAARESRTEEAEAADKATAEQEQVEAVEADSTGTPASEDAASPEGVATSSAEVPAEDS